jgi:uncharacterized protein YndB with AHSA1/START domain
MSRATMPQSVISPDLDGLVCEIDIAAPPQRVFQALIDEGQLMHWFNGDASCPVKFWKLDPRKGGHYHYRTGKATHAVNGVTEFDCQGEILEFDPPRLLAYTWIGNWHDDKQLKTIVRYDLTATPRGTHVKVTHSGLATEEVCRNDYANGWPGVFTSLKKFVESQQVGS